MARIDQNGQPQPWLNWALRWGRSLDELIGLCKGVLADGALTAAEASYILNWLDANPDAAREWPADVLYEQLKRTVTPQELNPSDEEGLVDLLLQITGRPMNAAIPENMPTTLPLDSPAPPVLFDGRGFCFTGKFSRGSRRECEAHVLERGGVVLDSVTRALNYLVIGSVGSRDWLHSSFGRKIQKAVHYRSTGTDLRIISEDHWSQQL